MTSTPAPFINNIKDKTTNTDQQQSESTPETEPVILHTSTTTLYPVYKKATAIPKFFHTKPPKST